MQPFINRSKLNTKAVLLFTKPRFVNSKFFDYVEYYSELCSEGVNMPVVCNCFTIAAKTLNINKIYIIHCK